MIVTVTEFDNFTGNMEDSDAAVALKTMQLKAAQELVENYLRYNPEENWNADNMPALIKETILRIASLMLMEAGENIGLTGKSFSDNSRSFVSYTNYDKYLRPIQNFRKVFF